MWRGGAWPGGACEAGGAWQGGMHGAGVCGGGGAYMAGRGHAWQGGHAWWWCVHGGGMRGRGQILRLRHTVNERTVRILLECILVYITFVLLQCVYFVNSGSEANDLALFLARLYTGAFDILSFRYDRKNVLN